MKYTKLLMPIAIATTAITPITMISSCGNKDIPTTVTTGDSVGVYKFKLNSVPKDKKVAVALANKTTTQEQVYLYGNPTSNVTESFDVADDGTVEVPVGYYLAPSQSASSQFNITFNYATSAASVEETVKDVTFNYNVDYDVDLKDGKWESKIAPAESSHWTGKDVATVYMEDVVKTPTIFQSDARYSTSINIKNAIDDGKIENIKSLRAYFNDIYKDSYGLNVQMNYEIKADTNGKFEFIQTHESGSQVKYTYTNFDLSCNFSTANGYKFAWDSANKAFNLSDSTEQYELIGRMNGKFDAIAYYRESAGSEWSKDPIYNKQNVSYDGIIEYDETKNEWPDDKFVGFMFANGLVHLTYNFDWETEHPNLQVRSNYAKNT